MKSVATNVKLGVVYGVGIGATFALGAVLMVLIRGIHSLTDYRISLPGLIALDLLGGVGTGAIVGLFLPFAARSALRASVVGFVAMLPFSFVGMLIVTPPDEWPKVIPVGPLVAAALLGGLIGPALRTQLLGK